MNKSNLVADLKRLGQSIWLDQLDRRMIASGELKRFRDAGITGVTANPTIFAKALEASEVYAGEVKQRLVGGQNPEDVIWDLLIEDVQSAADVFRPVYESSGGADGYVSIEVSPEISGSTEKTIQAARDLHRRCARPNVMVKIPATPSGLPAIRTMIGEGKNTNVTLIFGIDRYVEVVEAFLAGLGDLRRAGGDLSQVHSVASFFVSRVDTKVDEQLVKKIEQAGGLPQKQELEGPLGRAGVANSKLAYRPGPARPRSIVRCRHRPTGDHARTRGRRSRVLRQVVPRVGSAPGECFHPEVSHSPGAGLGATRRTGL